MINRVFKFFLAAILALAAAALVFGGERDIEVGPPSAPRALVKSPYRDSWAVVIGINNYVYVPKLEYAVADARAVRDALIHEEGFRADHVLELYDDKATKKNILSAVGDFLTDQSRVKPEDRIVIFFAGHGATRKLPRGGDMGYLIPVEGRVEEMHASCISMNEVSDTSKLIPARHVLWIVDACYSGIAGIRSRSIAPSDSARYIAKIASEPAIQIITAGEGDETVIESSQWKHSVFTVNLLNGLRGNADLDNDGVIPTSELYAYLKPRVTRDSNYHQTPQMFTLYGDGEFLFLPSEGTGPPTGGGIDREPADGYAGPPVTMAPTDLAGLQQRIDREREKIVANARNLSQTGPRGADDLVLAPAGEFLMGCNPQYDQYCEANETPQHKIYLDAFSIDRYEVTNAEYGRCADAGVCAKPTSYAGFDGPDQPAVGVSWDNADKYCRWAEKRLPTEAEWEKAARGPAGYTYPWGYVFDPARANSSRDDGKPKTAVVGSFPAGVSPYEAMDMAGNVWEWVADWYDPQYFKNSPARNPKGPDQGYYKIQKGGAWDGDEKSLRTSLRIKTIPGKAGSSDGFRCAK